MSVLCFFRSCFLSNDSNPKKNHALWGNPLSTFLTSTLIFPEKNGSHFMIPSFLGFALRPLGGTPGGFFPVGWHGWISGWLFLMKIPSVKPNPTKSGQMRFFLPQKFNIPRCSMGLEYLPTWNVHTSKPNVGKYSSPMEHIWDRYPQWPYLKPDTFSSPHHFEVNHAFIFRFQKDESLLSGRPSLQSSCLGHLQLQGCKCLFS